MKRLAPVARASRPRRARRPSPTRDQLAVSTWLRLLKAHGLMLRDVRRSISSPLTLPQFDVLAQLGRRAEGMTPGELTRALVVTAGNVTGIVRRLGRLGLVARKVVPQDRRAVRVVLTSAGRATLLGQLPRHRRQVVDLLSLLPDPDLVALRDLLGTLTRALEAKGRA